MTIPPVPSTPAGPERRPPRPLRPAYVTAAVAAGVLTAAALAGVAIAATSDDNRPIRATAAPLPGCPAGPAWILGTVTNPRPGRFEVSKSTGQELVFTTAATRYYRQTRTTITAASVGQYLLASGDPQADGSFDAGVIGLSRPDHGCTAAEAFGTTITTVTDSANVVAGTVTAVHGTRLTVRTHDGMREVQTAYASSITTDASASASALSPGSVVMVATDRPEQAEIVYLGAPAGLPEHD